MSIAANLNDLVHVIELAVAPVFLLAGIAGFLNVMSGRLGRIIDRARVLDRRVLAMAKSAEHDRTHYELKILWRRVTLSHWSIGLCTTSVLFVCTLIVSLFIGSFSSLNIVALIVALFAAAMLLLIAALIVFLKEVQLATRTLREGGETVIDG